MKKRIKKKAKPVPKKFTLEVFYVIRHPSKVRVYTGRNERVAKKVLKLLNQGKRL